MSASSLGSSVSSPVVVKSPYDKKEYRVITLQNGLKALLISKKELAIGSTDSDDGDSSCSSSDSEMYEEQTDSRSRQRSRSYSSDGSSENESDQKQKGKTLSCAACALCVHIGSFHDPLEVQGLAHLLEHMLFMGSKKYPGENEFDKFVSHHGGTSDASTDYETTVFHFSVNKKALKEAIDKFAHFFASPLINSSSLEREIQAVDSEFQTSLQSDTHRIHQLFCSLALKDHPLYRFPWGNDETLKCCLLEGNLVTRLRDFYNRYYSASCMTVTVVSEDSLDTLEEYVRDSFSSIPSHNGSNPDISHCQPVFDNNVFHQLYKVVPVKSTHYVTLSWLLPSLLQEYKSKPTNYIGWLLGHEGHGSVLSYLKQRNLATEIVAGTGGDDSEMNSCFSLFTCTITLTEEGLINLYECLTVVFQYLKLLQCIGPQKRVYKELELIERNEFDFKEEEDAADLAERLCQSMQYYPAEDYLIGDELYMEYNSELISNITNLLVPESCNVMAVSPRFTDDCQQKEKWFGTLYMSQAFDSGWTLKWKDLSLNPALHIPQPNTFIASDFTISKPDAAQTKYPVCIEDTDRHKLWYKRDDLFNLPRASYLLLFVTPLSIESIENAVLMELFVKLFHSTFMELGYEAKVAQLDYSLSIAYRGLSLTMSGLNHKLPSLFQALIDHFTNFTVSQEQFKMAVDQLRRNYTNVNFKPAKLCKFFRLHLLEKHHYPLSCRAQVLESLSLQHLKTLMGQLRSRLFVEALMQGNITSAECKSLMDGFWRCLDCDILPKELHYTPKCLRLPSNSHVTMATNNRDPVSPNTVITHYYQCSVADPREVALAQLLVSCMDEPCFDCLRTKKQLGYTVYVTMHDTHNVTGLSVNIVTQGTKFSEDYVSRCMDEFMSEFVSVLRSWDDEEFQAHVSNS